MTYEQKEDKLPVLVFGTEQVNLCLFDSQVVQVPSFKLMFCSKTLRVPIARYCLRLSGSGVRTVRFLVNS